MYAGLIVKSTAPSSDQESGLMAVLLNGPLGLVAVFESGSEINNPLYHESLEIVGYAPSYIEHAGEYQRIRQEIMAFGFTMTVHVVAWHDHDQASFNYAANPVGIEATYQEYKEETLASKDKAAECNKFIFMTTSNPRLEKEISESIWANPIRDYSSANYVAHPKGKIQLTKVPHPTGDLIDVDIAGAGIIRRAIHAKTIKDGDTFNVYYGESSKKGLTWSGDLENSILNSELYQKVTGQHVHSLVYMESPKEACVSKALVGPEVFSSHESAVEHAFKYVWDRILHSCPDAFFEWAYAEIEGFNVESYTELDTEEGQNAVEMLKEQYQEEIIDWYFEFKSDSETTAFYKITHSVVPQ